MCETPQDECVQYNEDMTRYLRGNEITWSHETDHANYLRDIPYELEEITERDEASWDRYWDNQSNVHSKFPE